MDCFWRSCRHHETETVLESSALSLMSRVKGINAIEGKDAMMMIIIINFCSYRSSFPSAAGVWETQELGKRANADYSVLISATPYKVADQAELHKIKIIKVAITLSIIKLILHYFVGAAWWNFDFVCSSTILCLNVSFSPWPLAPTLCLPCSKRPRVGVSIAQFVSGSQCHSEGPKKCSDFSIQEPLLSWMCTSSSAKETGENEACGVCLCVMSEAFLRWRVFKLWKQQ